MLPDHLRPGYHQLPWNVRVALALHDAGRPLPSWLLLSVQMFRNGGGCASCA